MRRALSRSRFARPYIWRLMSLSRLILPSTRPLGQPETQALFVRFVAEQVTYSYVPFERQVVRCRPAASFASEWQLWAVRDPAGLYVGQGGMRPFAPAPWAPSSRRMLSFGCSSGSMRRGIRG